ncbi:MAG: acyl-CoA reductase [Candidatus Omnitrophota bacterium]
MIAAKGEFKQFVFGQTAALDRPLSPDEIKGLVLRGRQIRESVAAPSQDEIIAVFAGLAKAWVDPGYAKRREAFDSLCKKSGLSPEFTDLALEEFAKIISPRYLLDKIEGELGSAGIQARPVAQKDPHIHYIVQPAGLVLHVASGNVFLAGIESLIDGIITRNVNFLKMSTADMAFPVIFAESIRQFDKAGAITGRLAVLWWPGGGAAIEKHFKEHMDRIVFWGGVDALKNWQKDLGESATLIKHGHKLSFGVISRAGLDAAILPALADNIALDISIWDQKACNCPQTLFLEESIPAGELKKFVDALAASLEKANTVFPPSRRSDDEYVEILKARELADAKGLMTSDPVSVIGPATFDWTIILEEKGSAKDFEASPLNRTIRVKRYTSLRTLSDLFKGYAFYLQTAGCCLGSEETGEYGAGLSACGVTRLCPFGSMTIPTPGTPHDGSFSMRDLTRITVIE